MTYDEETHFPVPRALFFKMREAMQFYARAGNYRPLRDGIRPVIRDRGLRALMVMNDLDALWVEHDTMLVEKEDNKPKETSQ